MIYDAIDDIKAALSGLLQPEKQEHELGQAEVRADLPRPEARGDGGVLRHAGHDPARRAGPARSATASSSTTARVASLRRFKDDVGEVAAGYECGIGIENFQDVKEGDVIEAYEVREVARSICHAGRRCERFDLRIRGCRSLKQKRHVVKALTAAIRQRFNVSVAEVDHQDLWQRATIAVAAVGGRGATTSQGHAARSSGSSSVGRGRGASTPS